MKTADDVGAIVASLIYLGIAGTLMVGWVFNVTSIWHSIDNPVTAKFILRCIGIFVFPIGGILGYL